MSVKSETAPADQPLGPKPRISALSLAQVWIWISVLASAGGWILSAFGRLTPLGMILFYCTGGLCIWLTRHSWGWEPQNWKIRAGKVRWRLRHALPLTFAVLALLILLGGALYPPTNHTATTYRLPRVLHWLAEGQWHWIHTPNYRLNNRACGIEWLSAPLMLFTKSDRTLFLLNFIPFLLMPGLTYSLFKRCGVRPRVAWHWMWLLPTGYCFMLQAGSTGNDAFPTAYAVAAIVFALRARDSRKVSDLWFSGLAMALLTGAKASNLTLLLPWAVAVLWAWPPSRLRPPTSALIFFVALLVSFVPTAILNIVYCGDWSGLNLERAGMEMKNPLVGIWGNSFLFALHNYLPPFFPIARWWNQNALEIVPAPIINPMIANFEQSFHFVWEMPTEDWVGLGFGVSVLITISMLAGWSMRRCAAAHADRTRTLSLWQWIILLAPWGSLLAYCMKSGMVTGARLIAPYYPLLFPLLLIGAGQALLVRRKWWQWLAKGMALLAIPILIVTPGRPLWPAQTILLRIQSSHPENRIINRALSVYSVYNIRSDPLAPVREMLPMSIETVGFLADEDDPDLSLWRPFGARKVKSILVEDTREQIRKRGIEYAVIGGFHLNNKGLTPELWMKKMNAELISSTMVTIKVAQGPQAWFLVRLNEN